MRKIFPFNLPRPVPSDMSKRSSTIRRNPSASRPSGITTAVSTPLYSAGFTATMSRPHAFTAARVARPKR